MATGKLRLSNRSKRQRKHEYNQFLQRLCSNQQPDESEIGLTLTSNDDLKNQKLKLGGKKLIKETHIIEVTTPNASESKVADLDDKDIFEIRKSPQSPPSPTAFISS